MGSVTSKLLLAPLLATLVAMPLGAQSVQLPDVIERTLSNHMKILLVERPGTSAVHVELFLQGGRADTGGLPPAVSDLLARSLFCRCVPEDAEGALALALKGESGAFEALRLDTLRTAQRPGEIASSERHDLEAIHEKAMAAIREKLGRVETWDALDALGATQRRVQVEADYLCSGLELPAGGFQAWCQLEAGRLKRLPLVRFPLERERLAKAMEAGEPPVPTALSYLLTTALAGRAYAQCANGSKGGVEAIRWEDLKPFAASQVVPEHLTLVIVGDVKHEAIWPALERSFGSLRHRDGAVTPPDAPPRADAGGIQDAPGERRLTVSTTGQARLFLGWRIPSANHPDGAALRGLAQLLGGAPSSRLKQGLLGGKGLARSLTVSLGVPGSRDGNLFVIAAEPSEGRSLDELEEAIQSAILKFVREPLSESEVHRAQVEMELDQLRLQEDAGTLAHALGAAQCQGGDWKLAFRALEAREDLLASDIQGAARTYLVPTRSTLVQVGPDPLLVPMDLTESRLLKVLTSLLQRHPGGEAKAQSTLREAMRQMRMLSASEREEALKLLEAQVRK